MLFNAPKGKALFTFTALYQHELYCLPTQTVELEDAMTSSGLLLVQYHFQSFSSVSTYFFKISF
jgi:hypothetical protein